MSDSRVLNIVLPTTELARTKEFFSETFSFDVYFESDQAVFFDCGGVYLVLHDVAEDSFAAKRPGAFYVDVAVEDLDEFKEQLDASLIEDEWEDANGKFVLLSEPNGNFIEVLEQSSS